MDVGKSISIEGVGGKSAQGVVMEARSDRGR
jgi:hypothetical protein